MHTQSEYYLICIYTVNSWLSTDDFFYINTDVWTRLSTSYHAHYEGRLVLEELTEDIVREWLFAGALWQVLMMSWRCLFQWLWWCLMVSSVKIYCKSVIWKLKLTLADPKYVGCYTWCTLGMVFHEPRNAHLTVEVDTSRCRRLWFGRFS
jgi:hypothetical protein